MQPIHVCIIYSKIGFWISLFSLRLRAFFFWKSRPSRLPSYTSSCCVKSMMVVYYSDVSNDVETQAKKIGGAIFSFGNANVEKVTVDLILYFSSYIFPKKIWLTHDHHAIVQETSFGSSTSVGQFGRHQFGHGPANVVQLHYQHSQ